ncbi:MAG: hypothetical protein ACPG1A_08065 [Halioglobus sp.]
MIGRLIAIAAVIGAAYWYWSGPYQERVNPSYETILATNAQNMAECMRAEAYKRGATGGGLGEEAALEHCAEEFNVYEHDGQWHRYDMQRPGQ